VIRLLDDLRRSHRGRPSAARDVGARAFLDQNVVARDISAMYLLAGGERVEKAIGP
jgi:hypothetical protein